MGRKVLVLALTLLLLPLAAHAAAGLVVIFLDVGEGEAIYIETPDGHRALVDTGNLITGQRVSDFLKNRGVDELDALLITHPHPDHMGGAFQILRSFGVRARYDNGQPLGTRNSDIDGPYVRTLRTGNYTALKAGDTVQLGKGATLTVLSPESHAPDLNRNSLVLRLDYGRTSFLLMGDSDATVERSLLDKGLPLRADVLKVGHHGSSDASSDEFIDVVSPRYAVISIDNDNTRGYPHESVIKTLTDKNVIILKTYIEGNVVFESNGKTITGMK